MTREQIESAVASGRPLALRMADGRQYPMRHRDYISRPPRASYVIVYDDSGPFTAAYIDGPAIERHLSPDLRHRASLLMGSYRNDDARKLDFSQPGLVPPHRGVLVFL